MFGSGGGTVSYREMEETDVLILWGSNAREAHPVMFHHMMHGVRRHGTKLVVVDPRRISGAEFATMHLPIRVGGDVALANAVAHVIIDEGLWNRAFIDRATEGIEAYRDLVSHYRPEDVEHLTGVAAADVRRLARLYATAGRAIICWTLGITEHHTAVENVHSLINLALLTGHVGRYGSGLAPLRGQNNVQGGADSGALPNKLPGFQDVTSDDARHRCENVWGGLPIPPTPGRHQSAMFEAMDRGEMRGMYVIGENPVASEANSHRVESLFAHLDFLVVQDIFLTRTGELADVVLPATASFAEAEGTFTSSERRVQLVRRAVKPPGEARDDLWIVEELARHLGAPWEHRSARETWDELRKVSPMHAGMSYRRLEDLGGIQWPCPSEDHPGTPFLHARLWDDPVTGRRAPFVGFEYEPPVEVADEEYPLLLTTGRRLADYNTGVQSIYTPAPRGHREVLEMAEEDMRRMGLADGDVVRVSSRRGCVEVEASASERMLPGMVFLSLNHSDEVPTNVLTLDATDPRAGTAEFKAAAVRLERLTAREDKGGNHHGSR